MILAESLLKLLFEIDVKGITVVGYNLCIKYTFVQGAFFRGRFSDEVAFS